MMPILNGYEVLSELRKNLTTAFTPFIFITAKATNLDLRQGMALGADDYITKPFTKDDLLGAVTARLQKQVGMMRQYIVEQQKYKELEKKFIIYSSLLKIEKKYSKIFLRMCVIVLPK